MDEVSKTCHVTQEISNSPFKIVEQLQVERKQNNTNKPARCFSFFFVIQQQQTKFKISVLVIGSNFRCSECIHNKMTI